MLLQFLHLYHKCACFYLGFWTHACCHSLKNLVSKWCMFERLHCRACPFWTCDVRSKRPTSPYLAISFHLNWILKFCIYTPFCCFFVVVIVMQPTGNHAHKELANFGYRSERKVENFENPSIFWHPLKTYCINMTISEKKQFMKCGDFGKLFS